MGFNSGFKGLRNFLTCTNNICLQTAEWIDKLARPKDHSFDGSHPDESRN